MNLLIVDDDPTSLKLLRTQLESEGHAVFEAYDGVDALALLEHQRVDAVISDVLMPRMDGYRLCHEIRKHARLHDLPIIIYTSTYTSLNDEKLAIDVGADKYLKKPVSVETIIAALHEVTAMPHAARHPRALLEVEVPKEYNEKLVSKLKDRNAEFQAKQGELQRLLVAASQSRRELLSVIEDQKWAEVRVIRLNRIYAVLSGINTTIVRVREEDELFREACRIAVEQGGFVFAWIGKFDADSRQVMPVAQAGRDDGYLAQINLDAREGIKGSCALTTEALAGMKPVICNDIASDERMAAWRSDALGRGYRSVVVLPLMLEGKPVGVFALYAAETGVFDEEEMRLLNEMAGDISYALDYFSRETQRKQAEVALEESRNFLKTVIDTSPMRIFWKDTESRYLGCNPVFARDAGETEAADLIGKDDFQLAWKENAELYRADDRRVMDSGVPKLSYDEPQTTPDGKTIWLRTSKVALRNAENETIGVLGIYEDITERKLAESTLAEQLNELRRWHDAMLSREMRTLELKREVNELLGQAGQPPRYPSVQ